MPKIAYKMSQGLAPAHFSTLPVSSISLLLLYVFSHRLSFVLLLQTFSFERFEVFFILRLVFLCHLSVFLLQLLIYLILLFLFGLSSGLPFSFRPFRF
jgi:hypothetical protein